MQGHFPKAGRNKANSTCGSHFAEAVPSCKAVCSGRRWFAAGRYGAAWERGQHPASNAYIALCCMVPLLPRTGQAPAHLCPLAVLHMPLSNLLLAAAAPPAHSNGQHHHHYVSQEVEPEVISCTNFDAGILVVVGRVEGAFMVSHGAYRVSQRAYVVSQL